MKKVLVTMIALMLLLSACSSGTQATEAVETQKQNEVEAQKVVLTEEIDKALEEEEKEVAYEPEKTVSDNLIDSTRSKISGIELTEDMTNIRPIVVMLDNHYGARPQAGLSEAEVVYEFLAEGRITRYEAVLYSKFPKKIGPIRSARPYFIDKALEYDSIYVHVGGSQQAKADIKNLKMAEVDGLSSGKNVFWRLSHKKIPHNMYSSTEAIRREQARKNYRTTYDFEGNKIYMEDHDIDGEDLASIVFRYKYPSKGDKTGYYSGYKYDTEKKVYLRYVNGKAHTDEASNIHLQAKNIIVQKAKHKILDNEGRRDVSLIGEGEGLYITNGKMIPVKWTKADRRSRTIYYDNSGNEVTFNPGVTWVQVVPTELELEINQ
ncbi:MAG: DUF3048 domain-containing protein [Firmicutes bacterium]|jgi:hypothetical protein|nr:DUF3048 domain-containing protein [Bacillota bacterium]